MKSTKIAALTITLSLAACGGAGGEAPPDNSASCNLPGTWHLVDSRTSADGWCAQNLPTTVVSDDVITYSQSTQSWIEGSLRYEGDIDLTDPGLKCLAHGVATTTSIVTLGDGSQTAVGWTLTRNVGIDHASGPDDRMDGIIQVRAEANPPAPGFPCNWRGATSGDRQ